MVFYFTLLFYFAINIVFSYLHFIICKDIIFFINLYQRWIYKIDKKRTNEFGTTGEDHEGVTTAPVDEGAPTQAAIADSGASSHPKSE